MKLRPPHAALLALCVALGPVPAAGQEISNPDLFAKSLEAAHQALTQYGAYDDPAALARVADTGYRLAAESGFTDFPFSFQLIDIPEPNAFALPGGQVFVTRGMLSLDLDEDMLACLLGHEIAHVTRRHGLRMQHRATLLNVLSQAALIGVLIGVPDRPENPRDPYGIEASGSRKGDLVQGTAAAGMVVSELLLRAYSRDFEDEADAEGQRMAAAAGFDPDGSRRLWEVMSRRIPQSNDYGYWRTHPFSDQRMRAAEVRARQLTIVAGKPPEGYREETQKVLLAYRPPRDDDGAVERFLETAALTAWPRGPAAEELRLAELHRQRDDVRERPELLRDYGSLLRSYGEQLDAVRALTPESGFLATVETEAAELRRERDGLYDKAVELWRTGVYQTPFLEAFLSNYPAAPEVPQVALALGDAYSRLRRQPEAVAQYLAAIDADPDGEAGRRALAGLRNLAPYLDRLAALQKLGEEVDDAELRKLSRARLAELAPKYEDLANGAEYLDRYPDGEQAEPVRERLETLAQNLYGEVILYQKVGDHVKALERIQQILTHAPFTRAADKLRQGAVVES